MSASRLGAADPSPSISISGSASPAAADPSSPISISPSAEDPAPPEPPPPCAPAGETKNAVVAALQATATSTIFQLLLRMLGTTPVRGRRKNVLRSRGVHPSVTSRCTLTREKFQLQAIGGLITRDNHDGGRVAGGRKPGRRTGGRAGARWLPLRREPSSGRVGAGVLVQ